MQYRKATAASNKICSAPIGFSGGKYKLTEVVLADYRASNAFLYIGKVFFANGTNQILLSKQSHIINISFYCHSQSSYYKKKR